MAVADFELVTFFLFFFLSKEVSTLSGPNFGTSLFYNIELNII
jgi:hypothetical protein